MKNIREALREKSDPERAKNLQRFFKTGKGEYGEGDSFLGIQVPDLRKIAKEYSHLNFQEIKDLLNSEIHEERMISLFLLVNKYNKSNEEEKKEIFDFYLKNTCKINNWDLVDLSAPNIVGDFLLHKEDKREILYKLAKSENLWEKRIAILSTLAFIRNNDFSDCLKISEILLNDKHDLIHKAVGWMLRELGKKNKEIEEKFLKKHYKEMPRTMLRYAIEKFEEEKRKKYLRGEV